MKQSIISEQSAYKSEHGVYQQVLREDTDTEIHVHDGPEGVGYTVYTYRTTEDGEEVMAEGRGAHCENFDWQPVEEDGD